VHLLSIALIDCERIETLVGQLITLERDLRSLSPDRRQEVAGQVDSIRTRLLSLLADLLSAEDDETRRAAAYGLSKLEDPKCVPLLVDALSDPDEGVRVWAVEGLSSCESPAALLPLMRALCDESAYVYYSACNALKAMGRDELWPLIEDKLSATDAIVRRRALVTSIRLLPDYGGV
jgi:HEAT repeat protein